jgi:MFS family permease
MNAGLPGTGIGGLFYIASALFMPVHRLARGGAHDGRTWRRVGAQVTIAASIMGMLFVSGWLLALALAPVLAPALAAADVAQPVRNVVRWVMVVGTAGLLAVVLLLVEVARLVVRRPGSNASLFRAMRLRLRTRRARGRRIARLRHRRRGAVLPADPLREVA